MNEEDSFDIRKVDSSEAIQGLGRHTGGGKGQKHEQQPNLKKEVVEYFHTLSKAVAASNEILIKKGLPYRFYVYEDNGEVFIDMVVVDSAGRIIEKKKKNISHQDFQRLIEDVSSLEGLFFDLTA